MCPRRVKDTLSSGSEGRAGCPEREHRRQASELYQPGSRHRTVIAKRVDCILTTGDQRFKALVVALILDSRTEEAIGALCKHYHVEEPRIGVGVIEGRTKMVRAVYSQRRKEILAANRDYFYDPFVMIHEFYHHLRSISGKHRGTERQADGFAADFIQSYNREVAEMRRLNRLDHGEIDSARAP